jgi:hypothetical protein
VQNPGQSLSELNRIAARRTDPFYTTYEEYHDLNEIRKRLFGDNPYKEEFLPECADDERAMISSWYGDECNEPPPNDGRPEPS